MNLLIEKRKCFEPLLAGAFRRLALFISKLISTGLCARRLMPDLALAGK